MDEVLQRDENHVTVLAGVTDDSSQDIKMLRVDPVTKRLLVSSTDSGIETVFVQTADATVSNSTSVGQLATTGVGTLTLPANFFEAGRNLRILVEGYITNTGTPTLVVSASFGGVIVVNTGSMTMSSITGTNRFALECTITGRTLGVSGTVQAQGEFKYFTTGNTSVTQQIVNTSVNTFNNTGALGINIRAQWGTASALNSITATNVAIWYI